MKMVGSNHEMIRTIKYACRAFRNQKWIIVNSGEVHDGDKTTAKGMVKLLLRFREINIFVENVTNLRFSAAILKLLDLSIFHATSSLILITTCSMVDNIYLCKINRVPYVTSNE